MGSRSRMMLADVPVQVVQRGVDGQGCFFMNADRMLYPEDLAEIRAATGGNDALGSPRFRA